MLKNTENLKTVRDAQTTNDNFQHIFQETIDTSSESGEPAMTLPPIQNIANIQFDSIPAMSRAQNIEKVEQFLNVLDSYNGKLGDPTATLKDMYPLVTEMENETEKIVPFLNSLSDTDELKDILNRAAVMATVEAIKFNRGDYL